MCSRCLKSGSSFCPKCTRISITKIENRESKNKIRNIILIGIVFGILSILINTFSDNSLIMSTYDIVKNSGIFFILGISFASAFYFTIDTDVFDNILEEVPFLGRKIVKYLFIGSSILGLPLIYFFYLIYKYFKK
jgi:hypothetical protein